MINFARLYPRFRDLAYLATYMARWDQAILALLPHSRCRMPSSVIGPVRQIDSGRAASLLTLGCSMSGDFGVARSVKGQSRA